MPTLPGKSKPGPFVRKWIVELIAIGPPILAAGYAAVAAALIPSTAPFASWLWFGIVWLVLASVFKVISAPIELICCRPSARDSAGKYNPINAAFPPPR